MRERTGKQANVRAANGEYNARSVLDSTGAFA